MEMDHHMPILVDFCFCKQLDPFYQKLCRMMQLLNVKECVQIYWMWMHYCQHEHKIFENSHFKNCFEIDIHLVIHSSIVPIWFTFGILLVSFTIISFQNWTNKHPNWFHLAFVIFGSNKVVQNVQTFYICDID
jgi:hypothetical protein